MAAVVVFHHAQGVTAGVHEFAERLASARHDVTVPDLYAGETFGSIDDGVAHAQAIGFDTVIDRGVATVAAIDGPFVVVGFSLGVLPAQRLAQQDQRVAGAVLCHAAIPLGAFGDQWPDGVALQLHAAERDDLGDHVDAVALAAAVSGAQLFEYDTEAHLVADSSLPDHDPTIAAQILERTLALLAVV